MTLFRVSINAGGQPIETSVKAGILASVERGCYLGQMHQPSVRINMLLGDANWGPSGWVQVLGFDDRGAAYVMEEDWIGGEADVDRSTLASPLISVERIRVIAPHVEKRHAELEFGHRSICMSYKGSGYASCTNACCLDHAMCPKVEGLG